MSNKNQLLIAIDLDGTLLTDDKLITPRTKKALREAIRQGHKVVISTGRPYRSSKQYYDQLNLDTPIVNFNGALIHHPLDETWGLYHYPLDKETAQNVIDMSREFGVRNIMMEVMDEVYLKNHDEPTLTMYLDPEIEIKDLPKTVQVQPTTLLIHPYEQDSKALRNYLAAAHAEVINHRQWNAPWHVIEIVRSGLSKAFGLEKIAKRFNIDRNNILAFGDEDNDLEMIQYAGTGVAMGNAIPKLKEVADVITKTNQEDGIAEFLERHVL